MSQTIILDPDITQVVYPIPNQTHNCEREVSRRTKKLEEVGALVSSGSIVTAILSTLLLRVASRTSFVLLGFYLGEHFTSASVVAIVLEAFYLSELVLAPVVGSLSDRLGCKPFLLSAPLVGSVAAVCFVGVTLLFPVVCRINFPYLDTNFSLH